MRYTIELLIWQFTFPLTSKYLLVRLCQVAFTLEVGRAEQDGH